MMVRAIEVCRGLLQSARRRRGIRCTSSISAADFPVQYLKPALSIEEFCAPINASLKALPSDVRVIAEPGRYISAPAAIAVASVMGRALRDGRWWYYLDDGLVRQL